MARRHRRHTHRPQAVRMVPYGGDDRCFATDGALALAAAPTRAAPPWILFAIDSRELTPDRDVRAAAGGTLRLIAEILAGKRPVRQLARRAAPEVCAGLVPHVRPLPAGARTAPPQILTSWVQEPAPGIAEAGAVVAMAGHVRALAVRMELHRGRWRCTALETSGPSR